MSAHREAIILLQAHANLWRRANGERADAYDASAARLQAIDDAARSLIAAPELLAAAVSGDRLADPTTASAASVDVDAAGDSSSSGL